MSKDRKDRKTPKGKGGAKKICVPEQTPTTTMRRLRISEQRQEDTPARHMIARLELSEFLCRDLTKAGKFTLPLHQNLHRI